MTYVNFPTNVNKKFYEKEEELLDNSSTIEYSSGRKTTFLKNSRFLQKTSVKLSLQNPTEYNSFLTWYKDILGGLSGVFVCAELGNSYYRFSENPTFENKQKYTIVSMKIEEVY